MDRERALLVLGLALSGPLVFLAGLLVRSPRSDRERAHWIGLWIPIMPAAIAGAALLGWAIQEPDPPDEILGTAAWVLSAFVGLVWVRAALRAVRSFFLNRAAAPAATYGWIRPRVHLSPAFLEAVSALEQRAAIEHEEAHARHRDPLRIWLAQLVTDLQWPSPAATSRFRAWLNRLEVARDDEARLRGADGVDLAAAILAAVRLSTPGAAPGCHLPGTGEALEERIARLLRPLPVDLPPERSPSRALLVILVLAMVAATLGGLNFGEALVRLVPGLVS